MPQPPSVDQPAPSSRAAAAPWLLAAALVAALAACSADPTEAQATASAQSMLDKREYAAALIEVKNALGRNPESAGLRLLLGRTLLLSGDPAAALIELRKAQAGQAPEAELLPELARALLASGDAAGVLGQFASKNLGNTRAAADLMTSVAGAHAVGGDLAAARQAVLAARAADPGYVPATVMLARLDAAAGDIPAALKLLDDALARDKTHEQAGLLKGDILLRAQQDPAAAWPVLRQVLDANPQSTAARVALITTLSALQKGPEARAELELLRKAAPKHPETLMLQAQFAFDDKDYKASRELIEGVLVSRPGHVRALMLAAAAEFQLKQYTLAEALLLRALKVGPNLLMARHLLAQTYLRAGLPDKAVEVLLPIAQSPDADATSLTLLGQAHLQAGDGQRSEAALQRALKLAPQDARLRTSLAMAQLAQGETTASIAQLESIAKADAGTQADVALVSARLRQNDPKGALQAIEAWIRKAPGQAEPLALKGRIQAQQRDAAGAADSFGKALALEPSHFAAIAGLAELEFVAGKPELARKRFESLLQADARNFRAKLALAALEARMGAPSPVVVGQLREAVRLDPSQPVSHLLLIERLLSAGDAQAALLAAQDASAALPGDLTVMDALGRAQIAAGDGQRAVSTFKRLAAALPKRPLPLVRLAEAHVAAKDRSGAAAALKQALEVEPGNLLALRGQALLAAQDKRLPEAVAIARSIQKRLPTQAVGHVIEGEVEGFAGNWVAAASAFGSAVQRERKSELAKRWHDSLLKAGKTADAERVAADWRKSKPNDTVFLFYLGDRAAAAKDYVQAEALYRAVLAHEPRHAAALNNVAWLLATQRKPGAVAMAEQADRLLPERPLILDTLSTALESEDQLAKALQVQKRATELDPKNPGLQLRLARLLVRKGDKAEARTELEALARLGRRFPDQAEVQSLLKSL